MDSIEHGIKLVLDGKALTDASASYCDYSLEDQISELGEYDML
jgi:hypothetical protein